MELPQRDCYQELEKTRGFAHANCAVLRDLKAQPDFTFDVEDYRFVGLAASVEVNADRMDDLVLMFSEERKAVEARHQRELQELHEVIAAMKAKKPN